MLAAVAVVSVMVRLLLMVMVCAGTVEPDRFLVFSVATGVPNGMAVDNTCPDNTWYSSTEESCDVESPDGAAENAVLVGANTVNGLYR